MASPSNPISAALTAATEVLTNSFGTDSDIVGSDAFKYLDQNELAEIYLTEINQKTVSKFLEDISLSIGEMRSSYLPVELVQSLSQSIGSILTLQQVASATTAEKESYENTFFRMLGMPDSEEISIGTNEIIIIDAAGTQSKVSYDIVEADILNERQLPRSARKILIDNAIFAIEGTQCTDEIFNEPEIPPEEVESTGFSIISTQAEDDEIQSDFPSPKMNRLESEIFSYSYLLIPPVQDTRISGCVNEPKKIVAPNFSTPKSRIINGEALRTSLLESIIRIRLDRLSGRSDFSTVDIGDAETLITSSDYGILESLFIIRIRSTIRALALKVNTDVDELMALYEQTGYTPISRTQTGAQDITENDTVSSLSCAKLEGPGEISGGADISLIQKQKIIEDSIMALLDDNSSGLNLQSQTQRNSSVVDSHLMGGLFSIIDIPRLRLTSLLAEEANNKNKAINTNGDVARKNIGLCLGLSKGVGAFDLLIFVLALFTMPEEQLLGLLDNLEYAKMIETFAGIGSTLAPNKIETITAVNTLTEYVLAGYELLKSDMSDGEEAATNIQLSTGKDSSSSSSAINIA